MVAEDGRLEMKLSSKMLKIGHFRVVFRTPCQNESSCETIHMKMCFLYKFIFMQIKLIFITKVLHKDSFWNRDKRKFGNGLPSAGDTTGLVPRLHSVSVSIPPARKRSGFIITTDLHYSSDDEISPKKRVGR